MGDETKGSEAAIQHKKVINVSETVPPAVRRLVHIGHQSGTYRAQVNHARGIKSVDTLGFGVSTAYDVNLISEEMAKTFMKKDSEKKIEEPAKEYDKEPKGGWPGTEVVEIAKKVLKEGGGASRPAAIFVLAACCRTEGPACPAAYSFVKNLDNADDLLLFVKYSMDLTAQRSGWGSGFRRAIKAWYLERFGSLELAEQLTRFKQRHSWSHKDVLKQMHAKPKNQVQGMVFTHAMFGTDKAREVLNSIPNDDSMKKEAEEVFAYLDAASALRKIRRPKGTGIDFPQLQTAIELINKHKLCLEHCDNTLYMIPGIWEAVFERLTFTQILSFLPHLRFNRILKPEEHGLNKAVVAGLKRIHDALTRDPTEIIPPVSPALVLISMQTYRRKTSEIIPSKLWVSTKDGVLAVKNTSSVRPKPSTEPVDGLIQEFDSFDPFGNDTSEGVKIAPKNPRELPKTNQKIVDVLCKILNSSVKSLIPTRKSYIFGVGNIRDRNWCSVNQFVMTSEAAALLYLCIEESESDGTVSGYCIPDEGGPCRKLVSTGSSISNCAREIMQGMSINPTKVDAWLNWLCQEKLRADVLVLMADNVECEKDSRDKILQAMKKYRKELKMPKSKLIIICLHAETFPLIASCRKDDGILTAIGFDMHLPFVIQHFAKNDF